jgi:hypothetical protein
MAAERSAPEAVTWTRPTEAVVLCLRGVTVRTAAPVALIVGTILSLINQGHLVFAGTADAATWTRVAVNYLVPFLVASTGFLSARRVLAPNPTEVPPGAATPGVRDHGAGAGQN